MRFCIDVTYHPAVFTALRRWDTLGTVVKLDGQVVCHFPLLFAHEFGLANISRKVMGQPLPGGVVQPFRFAKLHIGKWGMTFPWWRRG